MSAAIPRVLRHTVLPPVLGPVITTARTDGGTQMSIGTICDASGALLVSRQTRSGWRSDGSTRGGEVHARHSLLQREQLVRHLRRAYAL